MEEEKNGLPPDGEEWSQQDEKFMAEDREEMLDDLRLQNDELESLVVTSRDWTVETILSQIDKGNIDLNPKFQRRNAWDDEKRSKLIESLIIGVPVPQIVLAEHPDRKKIFIVIDGKQRLLTLAGFVKPERYSYWDNNAHLKGLRVRNDLNQQTFADLQANLWDQDSGRQFLNADIRCTLLSGYRSQDLLFDIFYRLNTTSVPLGTQELRQVLNRGPFADYLTTITDEPQPIHEVLGRQDSDPRLRDVEIILRYVALTLSGLRYAGNLKVFLDDTMREITRDWDRMEATVRSTYDDFNLAIRRLATVFGTHKKIGRRYTDDKWESRFNKALFEAETYYFARIDDSILTLDKNREFVCRFEKMCGSDTDFRESIESTTKSPERYHKRFDSIRILVNEVYGTDINDVPVRPASSQSQRGQ